MGHLVSNHLGKCKSPHGHFYEVELGVEGFKNLNTGASDEGMVIDYGELKKILVEEIDNKFDHGFIVQKNTYWGDIFEKNKRENDKIILVNFVPTAENLAQYWGIILKNRLPDELKFKYCKVWETPSSTAIYEE